MYARHNRVWLSERGWQQALAAVPEQFLAEVGAWRKAGWPVIARRADADAPVSQACLGIALPPRDGIKPRIALRVDAAGVRQVLPALGLADVTAAILPAWRAGFDRLLAAAQEHGLRFRVFGSVALEAITGRAYVGATSDIDLLFHPASQAELALAVALLDSHAASLPLDGEIVFPGAAAVSWKEWRNAMRDAGGQRVLVKGSAAVHLSGSAALLSTLDLK